MSSAHILVLKGVRIHLFAPVWPNKPRCPLCSAVRKASSYQNQIWQTRNYLCKCGHRWGQQPIGHHAFVDGIESILRVDKIEEQIDEELKSRAKWTEAEINTKRMSESEINEFIKSRKSGSASRFRRKQAEQIKDLCS